MEESKFKQKVKELNLPAEQAEEHIEYCNLKKGKVSLEDFFSYPSSTLTDYYLDNEGHLRERWNTLVNVPYNLELEKMLINK